MDLINLKNKLEPFNNPPETALSETDNPCPICKTVEIDHDGVTVCEHINCVLNALSAAKYAINVVHFRH